MELTPENCEYATAAIKGYTKTLEEALGVAQRLSVEIDALDAKMNAISQKRHEVKIDFVMPKGISKRPAHEFGVGDIIAYLNDEGTGWNCWEVGYIDDRFLYEKSDPPKSGDNIAIQCAYLVKPKGK